MKPPMSAVGRDASRKGRSFTQSTKLPRLNSQVEYDAATMLSSNAVGRISFEGNKAKAISARKAVPPAWPTVAYSKDTAPNSSANMMSHRTSRSHQGYEGELGNPQMQAGLSGPTSAKKATLLWRYLALNSTPRAVNNSPRMF